jgi:regulator of cell morphogenesis and NO signaling
MSELASLAAERPAAPKDTTDLITHIVSRYHDVHRAELPELIKLSKRVEAVHRDHTDVPRGLAEILEGAFDNLLQHMKKEEMILFPAMQRGMQGLASGPIAVMRHEHDEHAQSIKRSGSVCLNSFRAADKWFRPWVTPPPGLAAAL